MRITSQMMSSRFLEDLNARLESMERSQSQLTSGKMIQRPSDDPVGVGRALSLQESIDQNTQYQRNVDAARAFLSATETNIRSILDLLQRARELAVEGSSDTLSTTGLQAIGQEVDELLSQGVQLGNGKYQNFYLFGGTNEAAAPYTLVAGANVSVTPPVSPGAINREIGVGQQIQVNVPGDTVLPSVFDALAALRNAATNLTPTDVRSTISQFDSALDDLLGGLAGVGAKLNRLDETQQRYQDVDVNFRGLLSQVEDTDIASAVTELQMQQTAYQAALATGAQILQPSLIDFLR